MNDLTARQLKVLEYLRRYIRARGYPPTIREIRDAFGLRSNRGIVDHLRALERKGYIRRMPGISRGIEIADRGEARRDGSRAGALSMHYPVAGTVAAGRPEPPAEAGGRSIALDENLFGERGDFLLEVKGESMVGEHIVPGDLVVVRKAEVCESGALVVALVDGETTVKRLFRTAEGVVLRGANPAFAPILLGGPGSGECSIIGRVIGVIRAVSPRRPAFSG